MTQKKTEVLTVTTPDLATDPATVVTTIVVQGVTQNVTAGQMASGVPGAIRKEMGEIMRATRYAAMVSDGLSAMDEFSKAEQRNIKAVLRAQGYATKLPKLARIGS